MFYSGDEERLPTPEECAKNFLESLPECEKQMCMLAEQNEDEEVYKLIRRTLRKFSTEVFKRNFCILFILKFL